MDDSKVKEAIDERETIEDPNAEDHELPPTPEDSEFTPPDPDTEEIPEKKGSGFPLNDLGNGKRLLHYFGRDLAFVPRLGWFCWDDTRWFADEDEIESRKRAQGVPEFIDREIWHIELTDDQIKILEAGKAAEIEIPTLSDGSEELVPLQAAILRAKPIKQWLAGMRKAHRTHAKNSGNSGKISNMMLEASISASIGVNSLNTEALMLNTQSGTLLFSSAADLHAEAWDENPKPVWSVELLEHTREHLISKICPVEYDPNAKAPIFEAFLEKVQPDPEIRGFLKRWFGYSMTGLTTEQKLAFFHGDGRNGKSTLVDLVAKLIGDYGTTLPIETLTGTEQRKGSDATPDLVRLPGARLVRASEPEQGQRMKEALIKALTGGEALLIRRMMKEFVEIEPEFKLTISGNYKPEIRGNDDGIWRRILLVPWLVQIPKDEVDNDLSRKMWEERSGILNWLISGTLEYLSDGLREPESVLAATDEYRKDSDPARQFLEEECDLTNNLKDFIKARDIGFAFNVWLFSKGAALWGKGTTSKAFVLRATTYKDSAGRKYQKHKISDTGYAGILIKRSMQEQIDRVGPEVKLLLDRKG